MKGLEEENAKLRSSLSSELVKLAAIAPEQQEQMLAIAHRMGHKLLDPQLVAKFAREEDLSVPLFQHAQAAHRQAQIEEAADPLDALGSGSPAAASGGGGGSSLSPQGSESSAAAQEASEAVPGARPDSELAEPAAAEAEGAVSAAATAGADPGASA